MLKIIQTDSSHVDFLTLVEELNKELAVRDGEEFSFYAQFNKVDQIKHVIVAFWDEQPAGCGAIKSFEDQAMEIKRMFVQPAFRGKGVASKILKSLEQWTLDLGFSRCVLETGKKQPEAIGLYQNQDTVLFPITGNMRG